MPQAIQNGNNQLGSWYIIRAEPQGDHLAVSELRTAGFEIFSPRVISQQTKRVTNFLPLFPGYLFIRWDMEGKGKPSFHNAPHVSGWVNFEGVAPVVPDEVMSELAQRVEHINNCGGLWRQFKTGDKVRIVSGTLDGLGEVVESTKSHQSRVRVLMQFMGRLVSAQIPWNDLESMEDHPMKLGKLPRRTRGQGRRIRSIQPQVSGTSLK